MLRIERHGVNLSIKFFGSTPLGKKEGSLLYPVLLSALLHAFGVGGLEQFSSPWLAVSSGIASGGVSENFDVRLVSVLQGEIKPAVIEGDSSSAELPRKLRAMAPAVDKLTPVDFNEADSRESHGSEEVSVEQYLPHSVLSHPPFPLEEIVVPWPENLLSLGKSVAVFVVHIDQFGIVREVFADDENNFTGLEGVVRGAFLGTRFSPGQIDGRPVRSRIRIEVVFESILPGGAPAIATSQGVL